MQDHFDEQPYSRIYPQNFFSRKIMDQQPLQPWSKNNQQRIIKYEHKTINDKTFYRAQSHRIQEKPYYDKKYMTQRLFTFRKDKQSLFPSNLVVQNHCKQRKKKLDEPQKQRQCKVNQYNITSQSIPEDMRIEDNQFAGCFYGKNIRLKRQKERTMQAQKLADDGTCRISVTAMKKRLSLNQQPFEGSIFRVNSQNEEKLQKTQVLFRQRKRNKLITLGFQKFSKVNGQRKHGNSLLLNRQTPI